jgi:hypothetical protein
VGPAEKMLWRAQIRSMSLGDTPLKGKLGLSGQPVQHNSVHSRNGVWHGGLQLLVAVGL